MFGCAVMISLVLVYPHKALDARLAASEALSSNDPLTLEYLKVFLKADPRNHALRIPLAKRLIQRGLYVEAREVLLPIRSQHDQPLHQQAEWLELSIREQERYAVSVDSPLYAKLLAQNIAQQRLLFSHALNVPELILLGQKALATGDRALASDVFHRVATLPLSLSAAVYAEAAAATLGVGDYQSSAELYFLAMRSSHDFTLKRIYYLQGLRTLQSASLFDAAIVAADRYLISFKQDTETLMFLARLAQSANRPDAAARYAQLFLRLGELERRGNPSHGRAVSLAFHPDYLRHATFSPTSSSGMRRIASPVIPLGVPGGAPGLPFDDAAYTLGYNIFLGAKNLPDARRVAHAAVAQRPQSLVWRQRLARVSDWNNLPQDALPQWLFYARSSEDELAWDRVLEISKSLSDLDSWRAALEHKIQREPHQTLWLKELLALYEVRGEPELAIQLLQVRLQKTRDPGLRQAYLQNLADIYERKSDLLGALSTLETLRLEFGLSPDYALKLSSYYYKQNKFTEAFAELYRVRDQVPKNHEEFWRTYAEMGSFLQNDDMAEAGYRTLLENELFTEHDLENLLAVWMTQKPRAAEKLAVFAYFNTRKKIKSSLVTSMQTADGRALTWEQDFEVSINLFPPRFAGLALHLMVRLAHWDAARQFLASLTAQQLSVLEKDVFFLTSRAVLAQSTQHLNAAERDMRAALDMDAGNMDLRAGLIWVLIAGRKTEPLKHVLGAWATEAESNAVLWGAYAAALMSLNRQREALHWFRKSGIQRDDYLWQMSYAECLEANSQPELAWRIRRHAWLNLRKPSVLQSLLSDSFIALRERLAALAPLFSTHDDAQRIIQHLLRADVHTLQAVANVSDVPHTGQELVQHLLNIDNTPVQEASLGKVETVGDLYRSSGGKRPVDDARLSASVKELALAYAMNNEAYDLAQIWLVTRFANQLAKPLWGELSLLLLSDDRHQLVRLLDEVPDWLPMYDRIEAAQRSGSRGQAQTWAFDQLAYLPNDLQLHAQLIERTIAPHTSTQARITSQQLGVLTSVETHLNAGIFLSPTLSITPKLVRRSQFSSDIAALPNVPRMDETVALTLHRLTDKGYWAATVAHRQSAVAHQGIVLDYSTTWARTLQLVASLGLNQATSDSTLLRLGGMRRGIEVSGIYGVSSRDYARLDLGVQQYDTQSGTPLGTGSHWGLEWGSRFRLAYPDIILRASVSSNQFSRTGRYDAQIARLAPVGVNLANFAFMPVSSMTAGVTLGLGTSAEQAYTRGWRPFAEIGCSQNSISGLGYHLRGGLAGSVLGNDVLRLHLQSVSSSPQVLQGTQELGVHYQWFY